MAFTLTDLQKVVCTIKPIDAVGNPAPVQGVPVWTSSDETVCTVTPAEGGLTATVLTVGPLGTCQIKCEADADLGEGVTLISGILDVEVIGSQATSVGITAGTPELK